MDRYVVVGFIWALILAAVGVIVYVVVFDIEKDEVSKIHELQVSYLAFTETLIDKDGNIVSASKEVLTERLEALKKVRLSAGTVGSTYFDTFLFYGERIEAERKSGKVSMVRIPTWSDFLENLYTWGSVGFWLLLGSCAFISFAIYSHDLAYRLVYPPYCLLDLPWQKPWTWIFVLATIPANIPFFTVSAIRIVLRNRSEARLRILRADAGEQTQAEWQPDIRWIAPREAGVKTLGAREYAKTKDAWVELRAEMRREEWQKRVVFLRQVVETSKQNLNNHGQSIIRVQDDLARAMRELKGAEASEPSSSFELPDISQVESEFERLVNLPQVARVEVSKKEISVMTHPAIIYINDRPRDFGSYKITITTGYSLSGVKVQCVFSTRSEGSGHIYGDDRSGNFCFGSRRNTLDGLLLRGEYLAAIILMLEGLHYVNVGNEQEATRLYPEVQSASA